MSRGLRPGGWFIAGLAVALLLAVLAVALVTQSKQGHERILAFTLRTLGGKLNGKLDVGRLEGNLFSGARLYDLSLRGRDGHPLVVADSAYINYSVATFLGGDIVIRRLVLYQPDISLRKLPGDSLWNYQQILTDTTARDTTQPGRATLVEKIVAVGARAAVEFPWQPDSTLSARAQAREVEVALADSTRMDVRRVPGGLLQRWRFAFSRAALSELIIAPDERGGTYLRVDSAAGEARIWRDPPMRIRDARAEVALRAGVVRLRVPEARLPGSTLAVQGRIDMRPRIPVYDVTVTTPDFAFADLHWLYPAFPDSGGGSGRITIETHGNGLLYHARDLRVRAPGTRLTGSFGMTMGDTIRFVDVDLEADPLNMQTVERMLPEGLPVEGLRIGAAEVHGPISSTTATSATDAPAAGAGGRS